MGKVATILLAAIACSAIPNCAKAQKAQMERAHISGQMLAVAQVSITGFWKADDQGLYQIRQEGNHVWWYGRSADEGQAWQNVFSGTITEDGMVVGTWCDLPPGNAQGSGTLRLRIEPGRLARAEESGGFGGSEWVRASGAEAGEDRAGQCKGDLRAAVDKMTGGKADAAIRLPPNSNWSTYTDELLRVMRRLAGDEAVNEYVRVESSWGLKTGAERVEARVVAIGKMFP